MRRVIYLWYSKCSIFDLNLDGVSAVNTFD